MAGSVPLVGRRYVVDLVRELVHRPDRQRRPHNRHAPMVVVEGRRGAGKSRLLTALAELMDQRIPYALLDLESAGPAEVPPMLSALAFALSRRCPGYGRLRFPRLVVGLVVMNEQLDLQDRVAARKQVRSVLGRHRGIDTAIGFLQQTAGGLLAGVSLTPQVPTDAVSRVLLGAARLAGAWRPSRRVIFGRHLDWYGDQGPGPATDATEVLIDLNRRAQQPAVSRADRRHIDSLLLAAFLADLRDSFRSTRTPAGRQSLGCAVLLDNADDPVHQELLRRFASARHQQLDAADGAADPLTVVVTSAGGLTAAVPGNERSVYTSDDDGFDAFVQRTGHSRQARWLRCALRDFTEEEIGELVDAMEVAVANPEHLRQVVYAMTGGQPRETRLLLAAAAALPGGRVDLDASLRRVDPDVAGEPAEQHIVDRLLSGVAAEFVEDLVTCSAARDQDRMLQLATQGDLVATEDLQQLVASAAGLWRAPGDDQPLLLRRLLQRRLADRPAHAAASWDAVHTWLQKDYEQDGNDEAVLFHLLARRELATVTRLIEERLVRISGAELLALLRTVTAAPNTLDHDRDPVAHLEELTRDLDPRARPATPLARLVAGLWLAGDPTFSDRRAALHRRIAAEYTAVAAYCPVGAADLLLESQRHQQLAQWWL